MEFSICRQPLGLKVASGGSTFFLLLFELEETLMKTACLLFITLFMTAGASSLASAGEPNPDAFTGGQKSEKSKAMPGNDCGPEASQEVSGPDAATLAE